MAAMMAAVIALGSGCAGLQAGAGATSEAHRSALQLFPILLTARPAWTGEIRAAKLRVWADQEYRAQNPQWQQDLDDNVAYANRVLIPMLGVGLAAEYRAWDHRAQGGELAVRSSSGATQSQPLVGSASARWRRVGHRGRCTCSARWSWRRVAAPPRAAWRI
jgi:hypothetical protein